MEPLQRCASVGQVPDGGAYRRRPGESLSSLHQDIRRLMALAYPTLQPDARESGVPLPDTNPEEEESLAGALERQGATLWLGLGLSLADLRNGGPELLITWRYVTCTTNY